MSSSYQPSLDQIRRAVEISEHILRLQKDLERTLAMIQQEQSAQDDPAALVINSFNALSQAAPRRAERHLSRDARERIAAAQRRRWEKVRNNKEGLSN